MVDLHAHILPNVDHGSNGINTSLQQIRMAEKAGVKKIVATPHFYNNKDNLSEFLDRRDAGYNALKNTLTAKNINIEIIKAAEVNLQVDLFKNDLRKLCIGDTNYLLLEMPMNVNWTFWHYDAIDEIIALGINPIIAHINRYSSYFLQRLFKKDILYQINIEAFLTFSSRRKALSLYKNGYAHFIGSDIHGKDNNPYEIMAKYKTKY
ncbi:MAG: hypothetical protein IJO19_03265, partial [Clostridia bacterium]|nr:hypothetical protein [Clostridia bacterium]